MSLKSCGETVCAAPKLPAHRHASGRETNRRRQGKGEADHPFGKGLLDPHKIEARQFFRRVTMRCRSKSVLNVIVTESPCVNPFNFVMKFLSL